METEERATTESERPAAGGEALREALEERNRLWAELNQERADQRELEYLRGELAMIRGSNMWKVAVRYQRAKRLVLTGLRRLRQG